MWNNNRDNDSNYGGSPPPPFPSFPSAAYGSPMPVPHSGYSPSYAPGPQYGFGTPQGPPPHPFSPPPGPPHSGYFPPGPPPSGHAPPPGPPPPGHAPPPGPPPPGHAPPPGPPPPGHAPPPGPPPPGRSPIGPPPPSGYAPPPGPPPPGRSPIGPPPQSGYASPPGPPPPGRRPIGSPPQSGYASPPGPPPPGYASPQGPPPPGRSPIGSPPQSGYAPPPGPPPPGRSPIGSPTQSGYAPPPGPPPSGYGAPLERGFPSQQHQQYPQGGYPGQQAHSGYPGQSPSGGDQYRQAPPPPPTHVQNYGPDGAKYQFQYSQCTGKKKALCIGINYFGQSAELKGCINDANNMKNFLCTHYGYKKDDIVILTDDSTIPRMMPTRENILQAMQWLVRGASPHDALFFHYSGHGGQTKDLIGDKADGFEDVIYPVDFEANGHIVDDLMHRTMVKPLPAGCRLTAIFDSCHSGTALDLPYVYSTEGKIKEPNLAAEAGRDVLTAVTSYARGDMGGVLKSAMDLVKTAAGSANAQKAEQISRATRTSPADVISWSGCKDSQTSADTEAAGRPIGAMTFAFISVLSRNKEQSYLQLLIGVREILKNKYSQKPQLSSSHPMDTNILFIC